ncbi:hypothetical protein TNCV_908541 [Trichonephila clavipes]|nr:hypothetical protein TNCV_908541 [Trichonephila clavipes]
MSFLWFRITEKYHSVEFPAKRIRSSAEQPLHAFLKEILITTFPQQRRKLTQLDYVLFAAQRETIKGRRWDEKQDSSALVYAHGSIKEYQACLETTLVGDSLQTDHLIGTSAHAPQRPMVTYTGRDTVGPGPHGLLRF